MMKELVLLAFANSGLAQAGQSRDSAQPITAHWLERDIPEGHISIPQILEKRLLDIRAEHMRWAYDMGRLPISRPGCAKEELQLAFIAGCEPSMWWTSLIYERHPKLSPSLYTIYKLRCLEILLAENGCDSLRLCGGDKLLHVTLARFCMAAGISFVHEAVKDAPPRPRQSLVTRLYAAAPAPLRAAARFVHWWATVRRHLPFAGNPAVYPVDNSGAQGRTATIATYFPNIDMQAGAKGRFRSRYWEDLHTALNGQAILERPHGPHFVRWLFIRFPSPQLDFAQCRKLRDLFQREGRDGLSYNYLEEFLKTSDLWRAVGRWLKLGRASRACAGQVENACHFQGSRINFWLYIKEEWKESFEGWRCLERCLQNLAFKRYFTMAGPQRWTLFPLENCPWERMLTLACRENHAGLVLGAQHSTIRPTDFRYFDDPRTFSAQDCARFQPDIVCGNGEAARGQWLACGMPKDRLKLVEALRYIYLVKNKASALQQEPLEGPARKRLVVLTSFFADETNAHLELLEQALAAGLLRDWLVTIKPHPCLSVEAWLNGLPESQKKRIRIASGPLASELKPGVAVWASNSTTAALEAALENLPLMVMLPENDFDLCPIQDAPGLLRTGSLEDVRLCLEKLEPFTVSGAYLDLDAALPEWRAVLGLGEKAFPAAPGAVSQP